MAPQDPAPRSGIVLEPFRPPCASIEWRMGQDYWRRRGVQAFTMHEVPNRVINDGVRAARAARLFIENCNEATQRGTLPDTIVVLELAVGLGLFARLFLDNVARLSQETHTDYYERLTYYATEFSRTTLTDIERLHIFDTHADRVRLAEADAMEPGHLVLVGSGENLEISPASVQAVFCNYTLDVLPFEVLMLQEEQAFELRIQTRIWDAALAKRLTGLDVKGLKAAARAKDDEDAYNTLAEAYLLMSIEKAYFPIDLEDHSTAAHVQTFVDQVIAPYLEAQDAEPGSTRVLNSHGAITSLTKSLALLAPDGFILLSDFGAATIDAALDPREHQRFGHATAMGLNFPLLRHATEQLGATYTAPSEDHDAPLHTRLITHHDQLQLTTAQFTTHFDGEDLALYRDLLKLARDAVQTKEGAKADRLYAQAFEVAPESWAILTEWAAVANVLLNDHNRALELAEAALAINPLTSALAWNEYGDALYALKRTHEAHAAYANAITANPEHPRAYMNRAWTHADAQNLDEALHDLAKAFFHDRVGDYHDTLKTMQEQILHQRKFLAEKQMEWGGKRHV